MPVYKAGLLDVLRSGAESDSESRENAKRLYTRLCAAALFLDVACGIIFSLESSSWSLPDAWNSFKSK